MAKFILKSVVCPIEGAKYWAEEVDNKDNWAYLSAEQVERLGGIGVTVEAETAGSVAYASEPHKSSDLIHIPEADAFTPAEIDGAKAGSVDEATFNSMAASVNRDAKAAIDEISADPQFGQDRGYLLLVTRPGDEEETTNIRTLGMMSDKDALTAFRNYAAKSMGLPPELFMMLGGLAAFEHMVDPQQGEAAPEAGELTF